MTRKNSLISCRSHLRDNSKRTKHGALLDSELLAEVYLELIGGRQTALILEATVTKKAATVVAAQQRLFAGNNVRRQSIGYHAKVTSGLATA